MRAPSSASLLMHSLFAVIWVWPGRALAEPFFRAKQALPPGHDVDVMVWKFDSTAADSLWDCARADSGSIKPVACTVQDYGHPRTKAEKYLYGAFLNLNAGVDRADLGARDEDDESAFSAWKRPLLALKMRRDTCLYLVVQNDELAPLAGGRVPCPDLSQAFKGVAADMRGRDHFIARPQGEAAPKKIRREWTFLHDPPHTLDFGLEAAVAAAAPISKDENADSNDPFSRPSQTFDFEDYADTKTPPLSLRATLLFRDLVGIRLGYAYTTYDMNDDVRSSLAQDIAQQGGVLSDWRISRKDWTCEFLLAYPSAGNTLELPLYGFLGFGKSFFNETAVVNGRDYPNQRLLHDEVSFLFGGGAQIRLPYFTLGVEANLYTKDFSFRNATRQPDGSGSEIQFRLYAGSYYRIRYEEY
jgi:hypothetical protein